MWTRRKGVGVPYSCEVCDLQVNATAVRHLKFVFTSGWDDFIGVYALEILGGSKTHAHTMHAYCLLNAILCVFSHGANLSLAICIDVSPSPHAHR